MVFLSSPCHPTRKWSSTRFSLRGSHHLMLAVIHCLGVGYISLHSTIVFFFFIFIFIFLWGPPLIASYFLPPIVSFSDLTSPGSRCCRIIVLLLGCLECQSFWFHPGRGISLLGARWTPLPLFRESIPSPWWHCMQTDVNHNKLYLKRSCRSLHR